MQNILPLLALFFILSACSGKLKKEDLANSTLTRSASKNEQVSQYIQVTINNLRIRSTPDLEGAVIERLKEKAVLEYLEDSTSFTTDVKMNGRMYQEHWYKVKSEAGNSGWIYGGCIAFLPPTENKRIAALKADIAAQIKANGGKAVLTASGNPAVVQEAPKIDNYILERFQSYLSQLSPTDVAAMPRAFSYFESIFYKSDDPTADAAFSELLAFHRKVLNHWKPLINTAKYQHLSVEIQRYGSANMQTDELTKKLDANGLTFGVDSKGQLYLTDNVDFIMRRFYRLVSPSMREYLNQYANENEHPAFEAGLMIIPVTELAAYAVFWDKFLTKYPFFPLKDYISEKRETYATILLHGTTEMPAFNPRTNVLQRDFQEAYKVLTTQMGHSPFIESMKKYQTVLEHNSYTISERITKTLDQMLANL